MEIRQAVTTLFMHHDDQRVLMMKCSGVGAFPNHLVFPCGKIDPADEQEASNGGAAELTQFAPDERVRRIAAARELHEETGLRVRDLSVMSPLSRWITPEGLPARFDTWFYILALPEGQSTVIDGREVVDWFWADPQALLSAHNHGEQPLLLPTIAHLTRLVEFGERWRDWPSHPDTTLEPVRSKLVLRPDGSYSDQLPGTL